MGSILYIWGKSIYTAFHQRFFSERGLKSRRATVQRFPLILCQFVQLLRLTMADIHFSDPAVLLLVHLHESDRTVAYVFACRRSKAWLAMNGRKGREIGRRRQRTIHLLPRL